MQTEIRATESGPAAFDVERATPGEGEVVVATRAVALGVGDLDAPTDHAIGCAFSGEIVEIGPAVDRNLIGTSVTALGYRACGSCARCRAGAPTTCIALELRGHERAGGLAEAVVLDADEVLPLPDGLSLEDAALTHRLACAVRAVRRSPGRAGDHAAVIGGTPLALAAAAVASAAGYGRVAHVADAQESSATLADQGVRAIEPPTDPAGWDELRRWLGGHGPDVAFECSGSPESRLAAIELVRPAGSVVLAAASPEHVPMDINLLVMGDKRVRGARLYTTDDARAALALMAHARVDVGVLVATTIDVDSFLATAGNGAPGAELSRSQATVVRWPAGARIAA